MHASLFRVIHPPDSSSFYSFPRGFSCSFGRGLVLEQGRPQSCPMRMSLRATVASSKCIRECTKLPISLTIVWMTGKQSVYSLHHPYVLFSLTLSDMIFPTYSCRKRNQLSIRSTGQPILMVDSSEREGSSLLFSVWSVLHDLCYSILTSICFPSLGLV